MSEPFEFLKPSQMILNQKTTLKLSRFLMIEHERDFVLMKTRQGRFYFVVFGFASMRKDEMNRQYLGTHLFPLNKFSKGDQANDYAKRLQEEIVRRGNWNLLPDDLVADIAFAKNTTHIPSER